LWNNSAAIQATNATGPNNLATPQPGRVLQLPHGSYAVGCDGSGHSTIYTRNNDVLKGDGGPMTAIWHFPCNGTDDLLAVGSHSAGGVPTLDAGSGLNVIDGISFYQPEATTGSCINTMNYAGVDIKNSWFICNVGIYAWGNGLRLINNTCDNFTGQCIIVKGNGLQTNNPTHSVLIEGTDCYAPSYSCFQIDGAVDVLIHHNFINYAKQFSIFFASPTNQASYRVVMSDNSFITSLGSGYYTPTQTHIYMATPCVDCSISGNNKFMLSRQNDIWLNSAGITGLKIAGNQFYGGQGTSINVQAAGAGLQILDNNWDGPGSYAADFAT